MEQNLQDQINLIWAKSNRENPKETHLLLFHLLESAAAALTLWQEVLTDSIKSETAEKMELSIETAGRVLAYWVGLHDIGKASPVFQGCIETQNPELIAKIRGTGLLIEKDLASIYHSQISGKFLRKNQLTPIEIDIAISGHHGMWDSNYFYIPTRAYGDQEWDSLRMEYCQILQDVLEVPRNLTLNLDTYSKNIFTAWFSGLICAADWISSDEKRFSYHDRWEDHETYFASACQKARQSLEDMGWTGWRASGEQISFEEMYPEFSPNPMQSQAIHFYEKMKPQQPFLMIVEAPTGIGKTEIAMYLADRWLQQSKGNGLYVAMPTQATSNQIYQRSVKVLAQRYADQKVNITLAHGQARWNKDLEKIRVASVGEMQEDQSIMASTWFQNNRKRTLLAPFGVGTVDQIFLSILQTKHFFVRLFGLKNKVVIFDEVHAYDMYMNELFHRLLEWLRGLGVSVIILSATLPEKTRRAISTHYAGIPEDQISADHHYPRISFACPGRDVQVEPLTWDAASRQLKIGWIERENLMTLLRDKLSEGGCAAIICNTVRQAQETYQEIQRENIVDPENLYLFHARYPFSWRNTIEEGVLAKFGKESTLKNGKRPQQAILVATQVIEQSLDLDFDFMVSELAPVDLILQRAGRLHRHERGDSRPSKLSQPELAILEVREGQNGIPEVGRHEPFYPKSVLLKTYLQLKKISEMDVVSSTRTLIEKVYEDKPDQLKADYPQYQEPLEKWIGEEKGEQQIKADEAQLTVIGEPGDKRFLYRVTSQLIDSEDNNLAVVQHLMAKTRDGGIGIRLPCLFTNASGKMFYDPDCRDEIQQVKDDEKLSLNEISINNLPLIKTILQEANEFNHPAYMSHSKREQYLLFQDGKMDIGKFHLELTRELGLKY